MEKMKIALPVMLHKGDEVIAFNDAKNSLEKWGSEADRPLEVSAFLLYLPGHSRTQDAFEQQVVNQERYRIPIGLVETGVQRTNSLAYSEGNPTFNPEIPSDLERTIEQAARLRDLDPTAKGELVVAPHVGLLVSEEMQQGDFSMPSFFSVEDFVAQRSKLYEIAKERFSHLAGLGSEMGIRLALENTYAAVFENTGFWERSSGNESQKFDFNY